MILFSWCPLYYFSAFPAAKTRSHFSIVPERRGLRGEMTSLCQSFHAKKIRVTQLHTVPQASPKSPFGNWIHFRGFRARVFETYSQCNPGTKVCLHISFAFRWLGEEKNMSEGEAGEWVQKGRTVFTEKPIFDSYLFASKFQSVAVDGGHNRITGQPLSLNQTGKFTWKPSKESNSRFCHFLHRKQTH